MRFRGEVLGRCGTLDFPGNTLNPENFLNMSPWLGPEHSNFCNRVLAMGVFVVVMVNVRVAKIPLHLLVKNKLHRGCIRDFLSKRF